MKKYALISVFYKDQVAELAEFLRKKGYDILSSGGTYEFLKKAGLEVQTVESVTGAREILDGRVKTLHPKIHGGLLARRDDANHMATLQEENIAPIDVVCVNLYPFEEKLKENLSFEEMIEFIDIGGPSMLRSAAKNHQSVYVLSDPSQFETFMARFEEDSLAYRQELALAVFEKTSSYDGQIAAWLKKAKVDKLEEEVQEKFPDQLTLNLSKVRDLRYGENPHQASAFYALDGQPGFMTSFQKLQGKDMGYINYKDLEAAWRIASDFEDVCCAAVKHNTPCGVALGKDALDAYRRSYECDPVSIFGGIVALNRPVDKACAQEMTKIMLHIVCAPKFSPEALEVFSKKKNLIVIQMTEKPSGQTAMISSDGGLLLQEEDQDLFQDLQVVTKRQPTKEELEELTFAMKVVKFVKSNAIVVTKDKMALGIGGGYVNRVDAAKYALDHARGAKVLASDAFFPFSDTVETAAAQGITAIIQPGGSLKDQDSIDACDRLGVTMVFTGMRHFRH